jgi:hypothetical protein
MTAGSGEKQMHALFSPPRIVAAGLIATSVAFGTGALMLGLWNYGMPGVGLVPLLASVALLPIAIVLLLQKETAPEGVEDVAEQAFQLWPFLVGLGFCLFCVGLAYAGLIVSTVIAAIVWTRWVYRRPWTTALIAAAGVTLAVYVVFIRLLRIPLRLFWF